MSETTPIKVLVAGCSYAGIAFVVNLLDLCLGNSARAAPDKEPHEAALKGFAVDIHIVDERDGYLHLIGCPLAFASKEYAPKIWVKFEDIPALQHPSIRWTQGKVTQMDPDRMAAQVQDSKTGKQVDTSYDYFVAATGLKRNYPVVPETTSRTNYITETGDHATSIKNATSGVVVIGGGAVGVEMAAELKYVEPNSKVTLVHSRDQLLSAEPLPDEFKQLSLEALRSTGVEVVLGRGRVTEITEIQSEERKPIRKLVLQNGTELLASHVINAVSQQVPSTSYFPPAVLNEEGLVKINNLLRFMDKTHRAYSKHYAIGDIVKWSGIKRCGAAMQMGYIAADGMHQQMLQDRDNVQAEFTLWPEVPPMIALAIGDKAATYGPGQGVQCSEEQMQIFFSDDLGFKGCWNHMKLSEPPSSAGVKEYSILPQTAPYRETSGNVTVAV